MEILNHIKSIIRTVDELHNTSTQMYNNASKLLSDYYINQLNKCGTKSELATLYDTIKYQIKDSNIDIQLQCKTMNIIDIEYLKLFDENKDTVISDINRVCSDSTIINNAIRIINIIDEYCEVDALTVNGNLGLHINSLHNPNNTGYIEIGKTEYSIEFEIQDIISCYPNLKFDNNCIGKLIETIEKI